MTTLLLLPSVLAQLSVTLSWIAPENPSAGGTVRAPGSVVCTVHSPLSALVPSLRLQPESNPAMDTVTNAPCVVAESDRPKLMGSPATPAGAVVVSVVLLPAVSVAMIFKESFLIAAVLVRDHVPLNPLVGVRGAS